MSTYVPPKVGARTGDAKPLEWTGMVWSPVCLPCDRPMNGRDGRGWVCCSGCGLRAVDR